MEKFTYIKAIVAPLDRANVDTDAIIPKQFLKSIKRSGFGPNLFDEWRYLDHGEPGQDNSKRLINKDFVLNQPRYQSAKILLTKKNFGCGSSREHAPWALEDFGIRVIIAPSFADIFYNNCFKNGLLPIVLNEKIVDEMFKIVENQLNCEFEIDLPSQTVRICVDDKINNKIATNLEYSFELDEFRKHCLLEGLDEIGLTLSNAKDILAYENKAREMTPWLFV
jgi:3-isopropylmalate/(R)-2-methylmalate dehydratase small subunit